MGTAWGSLIIPCVRYTPIPNAIGSPIELDSPFDINGPLDPRGNPCLPTQPRQTLARRDRLTREDRCLSVGFLKLRENASHRACGRGGRAVGIPFQEPFRERVACMVRGRNKRIGLAVPICQLGPLVNADVRSHPQLPNTRPRRLVRIEPGCRPTCRLDLLAECSASLPPDHSSLRAAAREHRMRASRTKFGDGSGLAMGGSANRGR